MSASIPGPGAAPLGVRVPASTSNLGPGFDQLGLALELFLEVELREPIEGPRHEFGQLEGCASQWPAGPNLLFEAFDLGRSARSRAQRFRFDVRSEIPICRGLGSSGAAVAAGLLLARAIEAPAADDLGPAERRRLAALGLDLEGHPDNLTASLLGGCTLGVPLPGGELQVVEHPLHAGLVFSLAWPSTTLSTERARAALPSSFTLEDLVWNTRRLSLLLAGLSTGDPTLLRLGAEDRLHTAYRLPLIPGAERALAAAREAGAWMSAISGSGSGLIAVQDDRARAQEIAAAMARELERENEWAEARALGPARDGAQGM